MLAVDRNDRQPAKALPVGQQPAPARPSGVRPRRGRPAAGRFRSRRARLRAARRHRRSRAARTDLSRAPLPERPCVLHVVLQGQQGDAGCPARSAGVRGTPRAPEIIGGCANHDRRLHQLSHHEALRLAVLPAALARAARTNQNVDAFVADFGRVVDFEQYSRTSGCGLETTGCARIIIRRLSAGPIPIRSWPCSRMSVLKRCRWYPRSWRSICGRHRDESAGPRR